METLEAGKAITFRPSEYDAKVLSEIHLKNPHLTNANDLIRHAIRVFDIEASDPNSKSRRLERIEERLASLEAKVDMLVRAIMESNQS